MTTADPTPGAAATYAIEVRRLNGAQDHMANYRGDLLLIVNVASQCGRTPQYADLQGLHSRYAPCGFAVLGFPCNQFGAEEPGCPDEILKFCTVNYGITFPMFSKIEVNGPGRHPLDALLARAPFDDEPAGDIAWNFEKFLVGRHGDVRRRFHYTTEPSDAAIVGAIEGAL